MAHKPILSQVTQMTAGLAMSFGLFSCVVRLYNSPWSRQPQTSHARLVADSTPSEEVIHLIHKAENQLTTKTAWLQYARALPYFRSHHEQLEFLQLPDVDSRQKWLESRDFWARATKTPTYIQVAIDQNVLVKGMLPEHVLAAWGQPDEVHTSGFSGLGHMIWVWRQNRVTPKGVLPVIKRVYFESARVAGWDEVVFP